MDGQSLNITQDIIDKLKDIMPQVFSEEKIDFDKLKTVLGEHLYTSDERYQLSWAGKADAYKVLQKPTTSTLIPHPEDSINWDETENVFIEGENLEVLKNLQKAYYGKIKMIYIDPPYNTGSDSFIYPDKFSETKDEYLKRTGDKDEEGYLTREGMFRTNSKENGQYHSNWLNMMLPRLFLARNLLKDDGVIFVSIGEHEVANLKLMLDEIFGEENCEAINTWRRRHNQPNDKSKMIGKVAEYILCYSKNKVVLKEKGTFYGVPLSESRIKDYKNPDNDPKGKWSSNPWKAAVGRGGSTYKITTPTGKEYNETWYGSAETFDQHLKENRVHWTDDGDGFPRIKIYLKEANESGMSAINFMNYEDYGSNQEGSKELKDLFKIDGLFDNPKPTKLLKALINLATGQNDLVLDFFGGSGSLPHAIHEMNQETLSRRKYICVQLDEMCGKDSIAYLNGYKTISDLARDRIIRVIEKIDKGTKVELPFRKNLVHGFRKFSLSDSNFKIWRGDLIDSEEDLQKQVELFSKPQREGAEIENILWELLIKNGVPLTEKVQKIELEEKVSIYHTENKQYAFVLEHYNDDVQKKVLELAPKVVICLDTLFKGNDNVKTNAQLKFEDNGISFKTV